MRAQRGIRDDFVECALHAEHPGIAFGYSDRKAHMPLPQARMPMRLRIELRTAEPFTEIMFEDRLDRAEIVRVHGTNGFRLGQRVHAVVEGIDQPVDDGLAADFRKESGWRRTGHGAAVSNSICLRFLFLAGGGLMRPPSKGVQARAASRCLVNSATKSASGISMRSI